MFNKACHGIACMAVIILCGIITIRLIGFDSVQPAGWGDVLTLVSVLAASFIAFFGWYRVDEQQKRHTKHEAVVQAIILYRQMIPTIRTTWEVLNAAIYIEQLIETNGESVEHYKALNNIFDELLDPLAVPMTPHEAVPLLKNDLVIGALYLAMLEKRGELVKILGRFQSHARYPESEKLQKLLSMAVPILMRLASELLFAANELRARLKQDEVEGSLTSLDMDKDIIGKALVTVDRITRSETKIGNSVVANKVTAAGAVEAEKIYIQSLITLRDYLNSSSKMDSNEGL